MPGREKGIFSPGSIRRVMSQEGRLGQTKGKARSAHSEIKRKKMEEKRKKLSEQLKSKHLYTQRHRNFGVCLKNGDKSYTILMNIHTHINKER